jgi:hypothetical protein
VALPLVAMFGSVAQAAIPSVADLDATARASGNRIDVATRIGESIFATTWPAQVSQVSANQMDRHLIVGIRLWGVKFHDEISRRDFVSEVTDLIARAYSAAPAEEVDVWASVPIEVAKGEVVSGDLAVPTSRTVFSITSRRGDTEAEIEARAAGSGEGVFWDEEWVRTAFKKRGGL